MYKDLSYYYDKVFPIDEDMVELLNEYAGQPKKDILDVACGTGQYTLALADKGHKVCGVDFDENMISKAEEKVQNTLDDIEFYKADMLELNEKRKFDLVYCIGNSLVHLNSIEDIKKAVGSMYEIINAGGYLVLQVINFDRVINNSISELPTLKSSDGTVEFVRKYNYLPDKNKVEFKTELKVNSEVNKFNFSNNIELYALRKAQLESILNEKDFKNIQIFANAKKDRYDLDNSIAMLVVAGT